MKKISRLLLPILISLVVLFVILRLTSWVDFSHLWKQITWRWVFLGCVFYVMEITLQGFRANLIFNDSTLSSIKIVSVSNTHNFINKVTPARLGELAFPFLSKRYLDVRPVRGFSVLILSRLADFFIVLIAFSLVFLFQLISRSLFTFLWAPVLLWAGLIFLFRVLMDKQILNHLTEKIRASIWPHFVERIKPSILDLMQEVRAAMQQAISRKLLQPVFLYSFCMWLLIYLVFVVLSFSVNLSFSLNEVLVAASFAILGTIFPIGGAGHIGNLEAGWTVGLMAAGVGSSDAALSALVIGIMTTTYAALLALISFLFLEIGYRSKQISIKFHSGQ